MQLTSKAFENGGIIPERYTCQAEALSPPLSWQDVPEDAGSLVLIMDDPDDAVGDACHWVLYDIMPSVDGLREAEVGIGVPGTNDFGAKGYRGPCPPEEHDAHRYRIRLYAVRPRSLNLQPGARLGTVEQAMQSKIIAMAELIGQCARPLGV